jgi:hypothetical protein
MLKGDGPIQILKLINDNSYKMDLLSEYDVTATFNVYNLSLFDLGDDSRSNSFKERQDDLT